MLAPFLQRSFSCPTIPRRAFLQSCVAAAAAFSLPSSLLAAGHNISPIGLQLYTVRHLLKSDLHGTLAQIAAVGFKEVECAGYLNIPPKDFRAALDQAGLAAPANHIDYKTLTHSFPQALDAAHTLGHRFLVNSWIEEDVRSHPGGWGLVTEALNRAGEAARQAGVQLAYHNYWSDFRPMPDGVLPYDFLLKQCDPQLVVMEMDLCWAIVGGIDPVQYFARYPGRFRLLHVKDVKRLPKPSPREGATVTDQQVIPDMTEVGSGIIDWKHIFANSGQAGIQHHFIEHDEPEDPIASITKSFQYLTALRF